jgi:hypothetical protein
VEDLFDEGLAECEVELAIVDAVADLVERLPVAHFHTRLHQSHSEEFRCCSSLLIDLLLLGLALLEFRLETLLVHNRLEKHLVLIIESLLLLIQK